MSRQGEEKGDRAEAVSAGVSLDELAGTALRRAVRRVGKRLGDVVADPACTAECVHRLRVATRRAGVLLDLFAGSLEGKTERRLRKRFKRVRRAAARAREADVLAEELAGKRESAGERRRGVYDRLLELVEAERLAAQGEIEAAAKRYPARSFRKVARRLTVSEDEGGSEGGGGAALTVPLAAAGLVRRCAAEYREAAAGDLSQIEALHTYRVACKHVRYALELVGHLAPSGERLLAEFKAKQELLGQVNDTHQWAEHIERLVGAEEREGAEDGEAGGAERRFVTGARALARAYLRQRDRAHKAACKRLDEAGGPEAIAAELEAFADAVAAIGRGPVSVKQAASGDTADGLSITSGERPRLMDQPSESGHPHRNNGSHRTDPRRLAAIDVGTNSIRLIVAEANADGSYRVLDDEKEIARLGRGLDRSGAMDAESMARAVEAVHRMAGIARGYGAANIRVVGTAVVRDSANRDEFLAMLHARTGLAMQVVPAEEEARLAYTSAANAFDLSSTTAAVFDIGGGSTEVVLTASGVVEQIYMIPIGAVRMTERFGGGEESAQRRYGELVDAIAEEFRARIGKPPFVPATVIGTGGTATALGVLAAHAEAGPTGGELFSSSVQGREVRRWEIKHLLDNLRKLPMRERARFRGMSPDRADIIVAGLALIDGLLKRLGMASMRVHEGGIRDGLLLTMVAEMTGGAPSSRADRMDPMRSVHRFARACGYEQRHSEHVCELALAIFDGLTGTRVAQESAAFSPRGRLLLEAAAVTHDVGYLINYARHHKHSYHLIVHSELSGFSPREVEIIANVARYHRRAEPKATHANFRRLEKPEREIVRALAAILRVADGLDRAHTQRVDAVAVRADGGAALFDVRAEDEPGVDMWGAQRKSGLFRKVFGLEPVFVWTAQPRHEAEDETLRAQSPPRRSASMKP